MNAPLLSPYDLQRLARPDQAPSANARAVAAGVISDLGITGPPVDVEMVASFLDIARIVEDATLPVAGCLVCAPDGCFEIRVRATDTRPRQRFTICHECGHTFFAGYAMRPQYRCSPGVSVGTGVDLEQLCDAAASELLLPEAFFATDAAAATFSFDGLTDLASEYGASVEATGHRLVTVRTEPCALLTLTVRQSPAQAGTDAAPKLRLDRAHPEGDWPFFITHKSVSTNDVFDRALQGEVVSEMTTITTICKQPVTAEVHARLMPVRIGGHLRQRVVALARRVSE